MNVALNDCWEHLREVYADLRMAESKSDVAAGSLEIKRDPEALRWRGIAQGKRQAADRLVGVIAQMERYLEQSEGWKEYWATVPKAPRDA